MIKTTKGVYCNVREMWGGEPETLTALREVLSMEGVPTEVKIGLLELLATLLLSEKLEKLGITPYSVAKITVTEWERFSAMANN